MSKANVQIPQFFFAKNKVIWSIVVCLVMCNFPYENEKWSAH